MVGYYAVSFTCHAATKKIMEKLNSMCLRDKDGSVQHPGSFNMEREDRASH